MSGKKLPPTPQDFDERGNFVGLWKRKSDDLFDAASTVWRTQAVGVYKDGRTVPILIYHRPAYLLMGLCVEALLKGLLVGRDPQLIRRGKVAGALISHDIRSCLMGQRFL